MAVATGAATVLVALLGANGLFIASVVGLGVFLLGVVLWWYGTNTPRGWDEIGRAVMVSVVLAVVIGVPQYLLDQQEKDRDFELELTLKNDLTGADLAGKDLSGVFLQGKVLAKANLTGANLEGAKLVGTNFTDADLSRANLRNADLRDTILKRAYLADADLSEATFKEGEMIGASLPRAKLRGADLELTKLNGSCFAGADLRDARLAGADLTDAVLTGANVSNAVFESDLRPARLNQAALARVKYNRDTVWPLDFKWRSAVDSRPSLHRLDIPHIPGKRILARVVEVEDGDTIRLVPEPRFRRDLPFPGRARLIGLNAPDPGEPGGDAARGFVTQTLKGRRVEVVIGRVPMDDGLRFLVYLWRGGERTFNEELLETGYVSLQLRENREFDPHLREAQKRAKQAGRELWRNCPVPGLFKVPRSSD